MHEVLLKKTGYFLCFAILILALLCAGCTQSPPAAQVIPAATPAPGSLPTVQTSAGAISGISAGTMQVYHNIPYAAPPVGELRWKAPTEVRPWTGTRDGTEYSASCPQPVKQDPNTGKPVISEDCLYLNVWTPAGHASEKLPVMVYFHGGAYGITAPSGSLDYYNGSALAEQGVVVVTANYRLGAFGFLAHPELAAESSHNTSGNYGIMDQQAALRWVQKNIAAFGGDPSKVTIFGQSAGGTSTLIHLVSPESKGLFHQAITQSGPFWQHGFAIDNAVTRAEGEQQGTEFAAGLGYTGPDTIARMRNADMMALVNATPWSPSPWVLMDTPHFQPVIDSYILTDSVDNLFRNHRQYPVPFIIGTTADDGITVSGRPELTVQQYEARVRDKFGKDADQILTQYPATTTDEVRTRLVRLKTRYDFANSAKTAAASMADIQPSTYLYRYSYNLPGQSSGAFHGSENVMLFGQPEGSDPGVHENITGYWAQFAKTGNPNGGARVNWPAYTNQTGRYIDINSTVEVKTGY
jgi:para-nitrobenzyl esterase